MHRVIVVGRGLIGSAAGRHLTAMHDGVAVIGPDEPANRASHHGVFASHYDEGRMTRIVDPDPAWAVTAQRSIARYPEIEAASGIRFYTNSGYLGIGGPGTDYLDRAEATGRPLGADTVRLDAAGIRARFPFLSVPEDATGLEERATAGHVSPRALVRAQTEAARRSGATIVAAEVRAARPVRSGVEVETTDGAVHRAERALIATGAYTDALGLVPQHLRLRVFGRTVVLARVDETTRQALAGMPTIGHVASGAYILPPIRYPDGQCYVKIGIGSTADTPLASLAEFSTWFKGPGSEANRRDFRSFLTQLIPALAGSDRWHADTCAVAWTGSGLPYIGVVEPRRIAIAVGGNGKGAKSSDDWGWIAARLVMGEAWDHPVPPDRLRLPEGQRA